VISKVNVLKFSMDLLTVAGTVLAITARALTIVRTLHHLKRSYDGPRTISVLCLEATVISGSLSHIQSLLLRYPLAQERPELEYVALSLTKRLLFLLTCFVDCRSTFDSVLTGCLIVFSILNDELRKLSPRDDEPPMSWLQRLNVLWNEQIMVDVLEQMRGQQGALSLLVQVLQMYVLCAYASFLANKYIKEIATSDQKGLDKWCRCLEYSPELCYFASKIASSDPRH